MLITSGCSFCDINEFPENWTVQLANTLDIPHTALGRGGQGNGLISRKLIHYLSTIDDVSDLLVGVMWSGYDRTEFYYDQPEECPIERTTNLTNESYGIWAVVNPWNSGDYYKAWYRDYASYYQNLITTYEHILRTQWYLEKRNIKYFMLTFMHEVLRSEGNHPQLKHLWNMIDHTKFIKTSHYEWCLESNIPFINHLNGDPDPHPIPTHSKLFTEQIILPYLNDMELITEGRHV